MPSWSFTKKSGAPTDVRVECVLTLNTYTWGSANTPVVVTIPSDAAELATVDILQYTGGGGSVTPAPVLKDVVMIDEVLTEVPRGVGAPSPIPVVTSSGVDSPPWSPIATAGTYVFNQSIVRYQGHRWLRNAAHASVESAFDTAKWLDYGPVGRIPSLEGVSSLCYGDSYSSNFDGSTAPRLSAFPYRLATRHGMLALNNFGVSGTRADQILMQQVVPGWVPGSTGCVIISDALLNDVNSYGASPQTATTAEALRTIFAYLAAKTVNALSSAAIFQGPNWSAGSSTAVGAYLDFAWTGDSCYLLVNFVTGSGGTIVITDSTGATLATVATGGYAQAFTGAIKFAGYGAGATTTLRATVSAGTVGAVGIAPQSPTPPLVTYFIPGNLGPSFDADRNVRLPAYRAACAAVSATFPNVVTVSTGAGWDPTTMLGSDQVHPNDAGNTYITDLHDNALRGRSMVQGQNALALPVAAYAVPSAAYSRSGATAPSQVTGLTATTGQQISLAWNRASDGGSTLTGYQVQQSTDQSTWTTIATPDRTATSWVIQSGLTAATTYYYRVAAINAVGTGTNSATASCAAGALPTTYALDSFTRSNSSSLGSTETGAYSWVTNSAASFSIASNALAQSNSAGSGDFDCWIDDTHADGTITAKLAGTIGTGILFRAAGGSTSAANTSGYLLYIISGGFYKLTKRSAGYTTLVTSTTVAQAGDVVTIVLSGSSITVKVNGTTIITTTDSSFNAQTRHGYWALNGTTTSFDDFKHTS